MKKTTVGIPRGLLFYRYGDLWQEFLLQIGVETVLSEPTTQKTLDTGSAIALDETCLSLKVFFGHVGSLIGCCDYILIPRVSNMGRNREMCPRFESLYDSVRNVFRDSEQIFLTYNVDINEGKSEKTAFIDLGSSLGCTPIISRKAYAAAKKESEIRMKKNVKKQQKALVEKKGFKVLIAAHSYVIEDPYMGGPITSYLEKRNVTVLKTHLTDREAALNNSRNLSATCKWEMNREIVGSIELNKKRVDGIILLTIFPCGSDAMVNDLLIRKLSEIPILNLVLDGQTGTVGLGTRLESFLDIIQFNKKGMLNETDT